MRLVKSEKRMLVAAALLYAATSLLIYSDSFVVFKGDSWDYVFTAKLSLFSSAFWTRRAFVVPLVYKALSENPFLILVVQVGFFILSWLFLASRVRRYVRDPALRWIGPAILLFLSLSVESNFWNFAILSESISHSLLVLFVALLLDACLETSDDVPAADRTKAGRRLLLMAAALTLWGFARDPDHYTVLVVGVLILSAIPFPAFRRRFPPAVALTVVFICLSSFALQSFLLSKSIRKPWVYAIDDCIFNRILPDPEATAYFKASGMPLSPVVLKYTNRGNDYMKNLYGWMYGERPDPNERDPRFDAWVDAHGVKTYLSYLALHPLWTARQIWPLRERMLNPVVEDAPWLIVYVSQYQVTQLVRPLSSRGKVNGLNDFTATLSVIFFFPMSLRPMLVALIGISLFFAGDRRLKTIGFTMVLLCAMVLAQALVIGISDPTAEVERHAVGLALLARLIFWLTVIFWADQGSRYFRKAWQAMRIRLNLRGHGQGGAPLAGGEADS